MTGGGPANWADEGVHDHSQLGLGWCVTDQPNVNLWQSEMNRVHAHTHCLCAGKACSLTASAIRWPHMKYTCATDNKTCADC